MMAAAADLVFAHQVRDRYQHYDSIQAWPGSERKSLDKFVFSLQSRCFFIASQHHLISKVSKIQFNSKR